MPPSPWISITVSIAAFLVSVIVATEGIYRRSRERRDAMPYFIVRANPWYEQFGSGVILSRVEVIALNVSTGSANIVEAGIEKLDPDGDISILSRLHAVDGAKFPCVVPGNDLLQWSVSAERVFEMVDGDSNFAQSGARFRFLLKQ